MLGELFDPTTEFSIHEHCRPHWSQAGAVGHGDRFVKLNLLIPWSGLSRYTKSNFTDAISGLVPKRLEKKSQPLQDKAEC